MSSIVVNTRILGSPLTGVQRYLRELLARLGPDVVPVSPREPLPGLRGHAWEQTVLPWTARGNLLWSPSNTGPLAVRAQVLTIHDLSPLDHPEWFSDAFARWYGALLPPLARRVRRIIAVSQFTKDRIVERLAVPEDKVSVIYPGPGSAFVRPAPEHVQRSLRACRIPTESYVLTVGSLEPRKNLRRLVEAWRELVADLPERTWLVIVGAEGPSRVLRREGLEPLPPRVFKTGRVEDAHLPALYAGAEVFVYPSLYEGFGSPPIEAMAVGTPVIASDGGALGEVVGDGGLRIAPTVDEIGSALGAVLRDARLQASLRERARERVRAFSYDRAAESTRALLRSEL